MPGPLEIAASGLMKFATRPLRLANVLPMTTWTIVKTLGRARSGLTMAAPFAAPPTPVNAPQSPPIATSHTPSWISRTSRR